MLLSCRHEKASAVIIGHHTIALLCHHLIIMADFLMTEIIIFINLIIYSF